MIYHVDIRDIGAGLYRGRPTNPKYEVCGFKINERRGRKVVSDYHIHHNDDASEISVVYAPTGKLVCLCALTKEQQSLAQKSILYNVTEKLKK